MMMCMIRLHKKKSEFRRFHLFGTKKNPLNFSQIFRKLKILSNKVAVGETDSDIALGVLENRLNKKLSKIRRPEEERESEKSAKRGEGKVPKVPSAERLEGHGAGKGDAGEAAPATAGDSDAGEADNENSGEISEEASEETSGGHTFPIGLTSLLEFQREELQREARGEANKEEGKEENKEKGEDDEEDELEQEDSREQTCTMVESNYWFTRARDFWEEDRERLTGLLARRRALETRNASKKGQGSNEKARTKHDKWNNKSKDKSDEKSKELTPNKGDDDAPEVETDLTQVETHLTEVETDLVETDLVETNLTQGEIQVGTQIETQVEARARLVSKLPYPAVLWKSSVVHIRRLPLSIAKMQEEEQLSAPSRETNNVEMQRDVQNGDMQKHPV
jgi:hypothetical protein